MALANASVFEIRTAGDDTNGGGFVEGAAGTDYSQQDAKNTVLGVDDSTTDGVANGTTTFTSATANFGTSIVGNIISLSGGTGALAQTWRQVTARASSTSITLDAGVAAGTGITVNIGGALKTIGGCGLVPLADRNRIWIKAGTYTSSSSTSNVANGVLSKALSLKIEGYNATRGDLGTKPLLQASVASVQFFKGGGTMHVRNLILDGATQSTTFGISSDGGFQYKVEFKNFTATGITTTIGNVCVDCYASGCTTSSAFSNAHCYGCVATACTATPFQATIDVSFHRCIAYANTGASTRGFILTAADSTAHGCVAYANGEAGFRVATGSAVLTNCIAEDNTGNGFDIINVPALLVNCAAFSNATDFSMGTSQMASNLGSITGTGSFFTDAASGDFSLNNTGGAGGAIRDVGFPGVFPGGLTTGFLDIGAAQHEASSGGGEHSAVF